MLQCVVLPMSTPMKPGSTHVIKHGNVLMLHLRPYLRKTQSPGLLIQPIAIAREKAYILL